jgi:hypothetical protein
MADVEATTLSFPVSSDRWLSVPALRQTCLLKLPDQSDESKRQIKPDLSKIRHPVAAMHRSDAILSNAPHDYI